MLYDAYARSYVTSNLCTSSLGGNETSREYGVLSYISTTSVARDMLEILQKTGHEKLKYWSFSYGTMLGGMFAAMYPDKVSRMVNDGNVDYTEWTTCAHKNFLHDTDSIMSAFYTLCHSAGPSDCALWSSTPTLIQARLGMLLSNLNTNPITILASLSIDLPELITYSSLKRLISTCLYRPIQLFPALARVSAALEIVDGEPFLDVASAWGMKRKQFSCRVPDIEGSDDAEGNDDAFERLCAQMAGRWMILPRSSRSMQRGLMGMSKAAGAVNVLFRIACVGWKARAKWRFAGSFIDTGLKVLADDLVRRSI